ncbi:MAG: flavin oxidoreductase [Formosa sp.]|jgi:flavin reductase (DIM6/NTAB) family NADH-FMN oxidoreductase RutF|nr:flavin oxidoreductase [Formosa sp.]MDA9646513.1 flavin reductase [Flavobacteriaceae bacterium]|tara:strand:- start:9283 stop:9903 length:621 start_codon:yes stop_codon:yes gene_type:complete
MLHLKRQDFDDLDHLHRINLINSCSGFKSANLIGTKSNDGIPNVAIFSSVTHFGSNPPLLGIIFRPVSDVPRNTYENIKETGQFTINHIHRDIIEQAHHTSAKYDKRISEFDVTELEEEYKNNWHAPFVKGVPIQIALTFCEEYKIKANNTIQLIAEIKDLYVKDELIEKDGFINLSKANVMTINGLDGYALPSLKQRIDYQRPIK